MPPTLVSGKQNTYAEKEKATLNLLKSERRLLKEKFEAKTNEIPKAIEDYEQRFKEQIEEQYIAQEVEQIRIEKQLMQCKANMEK